MTFGEPMRKPAPDLAACEGKSARPRLRPTCPARARRAREDGRRRAGPSAGGQGDGWGHGSWGTRAPLLHPWETPGVVSGKICKRPKKHWGAVQNWGGGRRPSLRQAPPRSFFTSTMEERPEGKRPSLSTLPRARLC